MVFLIRLVFFFSDSTRVRIFIFLSRKARNFFPETLNQIIFFFLHQNQNIFFSNIGNLENPPLQVEWSFSYIYL